MALHVERAGRGPDLVLLHGWALHGGVWSTLAARLAKSCRVHAVDLPGHGRSRDAAFGTLDEVADAVAAVLPAGCQLCGWSLGALVAMQVVIRHRTRVRKLALVSATPAFVRRDDWPHALAPETLADFAQGLARDARQTAQRFVNLTTLGAPLARKSARELASLLDGPDLPPTAALSAGLELLRTTDLRRQVRRLDVPTLVIHGAGDVLVPVAAGRWLAGAIPGARLLEIAGAAHVPFASHGDLVAEALEAARG